MASSRRRVRGKWTVENPVGDSSSGGNGGRKVFRNFLYGYFSGGTISLHRDALLPTGELLRGALTGEETLISDRLSEKDLTRPKAAGSAGAADVCALRALRALLSTSF